MTINGRNSRLNFQTSNSPFPNHWNSTSAAYLLSDWNYHAQTPLMVEVHTNQYTAPQKRAMNRNPDTVREAADLRKQRQKIGRR